MALGLQQRGLWLLVVYHLFTAATACMNPHYRPVIQEVCLKHFHKTMEALGRSNWCDWDKTMGNYGELTDCTKFVAAKLRCHWPSSESDRFFIAVHKRFFLTCRGPQSVEDPPKGILCPFLMLPIMVTVLVTMTVVWRHQRKEGVGPSVSEDKSKKGGPEKACVQTVPSASEAFPIPLWAWKTPGCQVTTENEGESASLQDRPLCREN